MRFLTKDECIEWCIRRDLDPVPYKADDRDSVTRATYRFRIPSDAGKRIALCRHLWRYTTNSDDVQRLLMIREWSVWPSGEHMPLFERLRDACGEQRNLIEAPGQLFGVGDEEDGLSFLILATLFLWDYSLYSEMGLTIAASHDEFGVVFERRNRPAPELRRGLERLEVLVQ